MIGQIFGRLRVLELIGRNKHNRRIFRCLCSCGNEKFVTDANLRNSTKSCGCLKAEKIKETRSLPIEERTVRRKKRDREYGAKKRKQKIPILWRECEKELEGIELRIEIK